MGGRVGDCFLVGVDSGAKMKEWVPTSQIEPADLEGVVSGRFGAAAMFVAFSSVTRWLLIIPGGGEEKIEEPPLLFLEPVWAALHPRKSPVIRTEKPSMKRKKNDQLVMDL